MVKDFEFDMFRNYPQPEDYIPNNHPRCFNKEVEPIIIGATVSQTFEMPFLYSEYCDDCKIIYKQSTTELLIKTDFEIIETPLESGDEDDRTYFQVTLTPSETQLFNNYLGVDNTFVQLKLTMKDGSTEYSRIIPVKVLPTLDNGGIL